jgi:hypothetical protein
LTDLALGRQTILSGDVEHLDGLVAGADVTLATEILDRHHDIGAA